jgi:hypothetical protein
LGGGHMDLTASAFGYNALILFDDEDSQGDAASTKKD